MCADLSISAKGVTSVVNNCIVGAPPAPQVATTTDADFTTGVMDATKDHPTVKASVNNGVITLTGEIKRSDLAKLMMTLNTLKPTRIDNQLTIK